MSLSDFESDLTELSSEEEEYVPPSQRRRKQAASKNDYKVNKSNYRFSAFWSSSSLSRFKMRYARLVQLNTQQRASMVVFRVTG